MTKRFAGIGIIISIGFCAFIAQATSVAPWAAGHQAERAAGIFRGTVVSLTAYVDPDDGLIHTRAVFRVDESLKGKLPALIKVSYRGGTLDGRGEMSGTSLQLRVGDERLMFVSRRADGSLGATDGDAGALPITAATSKTLTSLRSPSMALTGLQGADLYDQAADSASLAAPAATLAAPLATPSSTATNLITGSDGLGARFLLPDRGESIPYLIDADYLPVGITQTQAVLAVKAAIAAWTNVTSIRYRFAGVQSFGKASPNITNGDGYLRIQLHDHYNFISGGGFTGDVLGDGGHSWIIQNLSAGWTLGGRVRGNDFHKVVQGYVVLQHTNSFMRNITNFTEVLCHEIGHTIGLAHSSQNSGEANPILNQAVMYYMAHGDGRGATLNSFDINVSRQLHPPTNTPPYCFDRVLDIVTTATRPLNVPGVNSAQVRGYDLQNDALTFATTGASVNNGTFSAAGSNITYVPKGFFSDSGRLDPAGTSFYDVIYARYSDGVNASPFATIRVVSFNADSYSEGIPDSWRVTYFGNANPAVGLKHHAADDADGDRETNLQEFLCGTSPVSPTSNLRITSFTPDSLQWQAKGYEVYELQSSSNLASWTRALSPVAPTNSTGIAYGCTNGSPQQFLRVLRVP
jgi:hypothetical protein